jgi:predicted RNase H-like HicB family nuclease
MEKLSFKVIIGKEEEVYHAYCPALKGCHSWGYSREDAIVNIKEAIAAYVEDLIKAGESIPTDLSPEELSATSSPISGLKGFNAYQFVKDLMNMGFTCTTKRGGHLVFRDPEGLRVTIPCFLFEALF